MKMKLFGVRYCGTQDAAGSVFCILEARNASDADWQCSVKSNEMVVWERITEAMEPKEANTWQAGGVGVDAG